MTPRRLSRAYFHQPAHQLAESHRSLGSTPRFSGAMGVDGSDPCSSVEKLPGSRVLVALSFPAGVAPVAALRRPLIPAGRLSERAGLTPRGHSRSWRSGRPPPRLTPDAVQGFCSVALPPAAHTGTFAGASRSQRSTGLWRLATARSGTTPARAKTTVGPTCREASGNSHLLALRSGAARGRGFIHSEGNSIHD